MSLVFAPLLPWPLLGALALVALLLVAVALWRGLRGWALRALALAALLGALTGPGLHRQETTPQGDIVLALIDETASQTLPGRAEQTAAALARLRAEVAAQPGTRLVELRVPDAPDNGGTLLGAALAKALAELPRNRVAGVVLLSDGLSHDALPEGLPAPTHLLLTGRKADWDRRIAIDTAPAFGIIGQSLKIKLRVSEMGAVPDALRGQEAELTISVDGDTPTRHNVPVNTDLELPVTLNHGGQNVVTFDLAPLDGELTTRNNSAIVQMSGVRDRLRVLLVSGEPYAGERTWRNLLKADAAVDLVHFTILRPPEKQDGVPVSELALIAFPTQELFVDKVKEFDLIIFDRYSQRGLLPDEYFDSIRSYVEGGGAVLVASGPEYAEAESLSYSPLGSVIPGTPTGLVLEEGYMPKVTERGLRHPVTQGLEAEARRAKGSAEGPVWGRWLRQVELEPPPPGKGEVVMEGAGGRPLLILAREGKGRIAHLASDQAWLWDRGFEGGGPQLALLRRLAHWMMKEPELEEEALQAELLPEGFRVIRRTMQEGPRKVQIIGPDGTTQELALNETAPGHFEARFPAQAEGLYRLRDGDLERVLALGPPAAKEYAATIADAAALLPALGATHGGALRLEDGPPALRSVSPGRPAIGRGWIGITPRGAVTVTGTTRAPLLPPWAWLALAALAALAAWVAEGRGRGGTITTR